MASLKIRKIDDQTHARLQDLAFEKGVSVEELVRHILKEFTSRPKNLGDLFLDCFGEENGVYPRLVLMEQSDETQQNQSVENQP